MIKFNDWWKYDPEEGVFVSEQEHVYYIELKPQDLADMLSFVHKEQKKTFYENNTNNSNQEKESG